CGVAIGDVARWAFSPRFTWSGSASVLMMLPRTVVPSQSMAAAPTGTGMPGAAIETMVNARTSPSVGTGAFSNDVPPHEAHALRRSKYRAPHSVHWLATRCGLSPNARYSTNGTALPT